MRASVIINPVAGSHPGSRRGATRAAQARDVLQACDVDAEVHVSAGPGDARIAARAAVEAGSELVIAWGGDGTVNEVASALAGTGVPLGIVPAGSGNGLARELAIPRRPAAAILHALRSPARAIDVGEIDGRAFVNVAGLGLDALIAQRFNALRRARHGFAAYVAATLSELGRFQAISCRIETEGETIEAVATLIVFASAAQYGNGARIAPGARPDDGALDLVVVDAGPTLATLWLARRLFDGSVLQDPRVRHRLIRRARVTTSIPVPCHVDGEPMPASSARCVGVRAGALLIRA